MKRCIIIAAGTVKNISRYKALIKENDYIICADGGIKAAEKIGLKTDLLIADFDSSTKPKNSTCETIELPCEKDDTDLNYAAKEAIKRGFKEVIIIGALGGNRVDHSFAAISTLLYLKNNNVNASMISDFAELTVLRNESITINKNYIYVSLFPLFNESTVVTLKGFKYNLDKYTLTADFPIGASNAVDEENAKVIIHSGTAILIKTNE